MSVKVCYPNYFSSERYSTLTASSAATGFAVTNLEGTVRRSKVWRSAGYFNVTSSNNVIRFRDASGGADKDATIAVAEYTTDAAFLAAVDAAMEAAGLANYTVTRSSTTKKLTFTSDLSGGASAFELRCADAAFTARTLLGFEAVNTSGSGSYTTDNVRIHTDEFVMLDLGVAFNPKAFALFGPRNEPLRISQTATVKIQGNATNSWTSPAYSTTLTHTDFGMAVHSATGLHTTGLRYWRVHIQDVDNARGYIEISSLLLGDTLTLTQGCPQFPLDVNEIDLSKVTRTMSGSSFAAMMGRTMEVVLDWQFLTKSEIESLRDLYADVGLGVPFHLILDPDEVFSTDMERWVLQVLFAEPMPSKLDRPNQWSSSWTVVEDV